MPRGEQQPKYEKEKRTQYCLVSIGSWTKNVRADHLFNPKESWGRGGYTTGMYKLETALPDLVEGGYVIDETVLADDDNIVSYVYRAPLCNGDLEGDEISRIPREVKESARDLAMFMSAEMMQFALMMSIGYGEPENGDPGPFDTVSASQLARYWLRCGARIAVKKEGKLHWSDGVVEDIPSK